jgi:peptide-methionine (S)-S-oxide reductase
MNSVALRFVAPETNEGTSMSKNASKTFLTVALLIALGAASRIALCESAVLAPVAAVDSADADAPTQIAVLAGGCFWGVEAVFEHVRGVSRVLSGYAGGAANTAHYDQVSNGNTGHAESVQITFDPKVLSYGEVLRIFFSVAHDPTQLNRQGPDSGTQYRSVIFYADDAQKDIATKYIAQLTAAGVFKRPIVTRIDPLAKFYAAESYHQDFIAKNPRDPYVVFNDLPKIRNLVQLFPESYRDGAARGKGVTLQ